MGSKFIDFYKILSVTPTATTDQIRTAFYTLAKLYHPDVSSESPEQFKQINEAYHTLIHHRTVYDANYSNYTQESSASSSHPVHSSTTPPSADSHLNKWANAWNKSVWPEWKSEQSCNTSSTDNNEAIHSYNAEKKSDKKSNDFYWYEYPSEYTMNAFIEEDMELNSSDSEETQFYFSQQRPLYQHNTHYTKHANFKTIKHDHDADATDYFYESIVFKDENRYNAPEFYNQEIVQETPPYGDSQDQRVNTPPRKKRKNVDSSESTTQTFNNNASKMMSSSSDKKQGSKTVEYDWTHKKHTGNFTNDDKYVNNSKHQLNDSMLNNFSKQKYKHASQHFKNSPSNSAIKNEPSISANKKKKAFFNTKIDYDYVDHVKYDFDSGNFKWKDQIINDFISSSDDSDDEDRLSYNNNKKNQEHILNNSQVDVFTIASKIISNEHLNLRDGKQQPRLVPSHTLQGNRVEEVFFLNYNQISKWLKKFGDRQRLYAVFKNGLLHENQRWVSKKKTWISAYSAN